jgi:hypothetical protein
MVLIENQAIKAGFKQEIKSLLLMGKINLIMTSTSKMIMAKEVLIETERSKQKKCH